MSSLWCKPRTWRQILLQVRISTVVFPSLPITRKLVLLLEDSCKPNSLEHVLGEMVEKPRKLGEFRQRIGRLHDEFEVDSWESFRVVVIQVH
jgi:hypothetical protein